MLFTWLYNEDIKTKWPQIGMIISGAVFLFFLTSYVWGVLNKQADSHRIEAPSPGQTIPHMRSVREAFLADFKSFLFANVNQSVTVNLPDGSTQKIELIQRVYYDFDAKTKFIGV